MRPRQLRLAAAGLIGAGLLAVPAIAQTPSARPVVVTDPAEAVTGTPDLTRVSLERAADGRLRAVLTLAADFDPEALLAASGPPGSLCLKLWTTAEPPDMAADHLVCLTVTARGRLRGSVLRDRPNALPERVAAASVARHSARAITVRFSQASVRRPATIRFQAEATRAGCPRTSCIDVAPDGIATARLILRRVG